MFLYLLQKSILISLIRLHLIYEAYVFWIKSKAPLNRKAIIRSIKTNEKWYAEILKKAEKKGITPEEMLLIDARYIIDQRKKADKN